MSVSAVGTESTDAPNEAFRSIRSLLKAGMDLGIPEAARRSEWLQPLLAPADKEAPATVGDAVTALFQNIRQEPQGMFQLAKEVWSRGGSRDKDTAAEAVGKGFGFLIPHRALQLAKELASMARNGNEAELVGRKAIEPILAVAPTMLDRVKLLVQENQKFIRQAALAGLIAYVGRRRKLVALGAEILLLAADEREQEIRSFVRRGLKSLMEIDAKATIRAVAEWARSNPTAERVQFAAAYVKKAADDARAAVGRTVAGTVSRIGNGHQKGRVVKVASKKRPVKAAAKAPAKRKPRSVGA